MKGLLSIVILLAFVIVSLGNSMIVVHYEINKKEITEKYCVNKDKPQLHCCGKCLLKKKLAEQEEQKKSPACPEVKTDIVLYFSHTIYFSDPNKNTSVTLITADRNLHSLVEDKGLFRPPCC